MAEDIHLERDVAWPALKAHALYLDVDGTLIDIAPAPDDVLVPPGLVAAMGVVADRLGGALALVSGRPIDALDRLFAPVRLAAVGVHGAEVRAVGGPVHVMGLPASRLDIVREALGTRMAQWPGVLLEDKGLALAVHYRKAPRLEAVIRKVMLELARCAGAGFTLLHGRSVVELKSTAVSKATGIATLRTAAPFAGRIPTCVGDDVTDESAFAYANECGGVSIRVGNGNGNGNGSATAARFAVSSPAAVRQWIHALAHDPEGVP